MNSGSLLTFLRLACIAVPWGWPLTYKLQGEACGPDIGLGFAALGLPVIAIGLTAFTALHKRADAPRVGAIDYGLVIVAVVILMGAWFSVGPYDSWLDWAADNWLEFC